jgi:hypothetical protein
MYNLLQAPEMLRKNFSMERKGARGPEKPPLGNSVLLNYALE